jgi:hypothetical protein
VRQRPDSERGWQLAAEDVLPANNVPLLAELAQLTFVALPARLAALAGLCAVLGHVFYAADVEGTRRQPIAFSEVADDTLVADLSRHGILRAAGPGRWAFRSRALHRVALGRTDEDVRIQHHAAALRHLLSSHAAPSRAVLMAACRHGEACGATEEVRAASHLLAEADRRRGR